MQQSILKLESDISNGDMNRFRTIFKTQHGRIVFLSVEVCASDCTIIDCFYVDRNQGRSGPARYSAKPKKLQTIWFPKEDLLSVIAAELDKHFFGVEFIQSDQADLPMDGYIRAWSERANRKYQFLILVGTGDKYNGLPVSVTTRLKNKLHRSIYVELSYYKDGKGMVKQCHYYDRQYKRDGVQITPPMLISCFFPYTKEGILNLLNHELCCEFNHILIAEDIDVDSNTIPLCGAL